MNCFKMNASMSHQESRQFSHGYTDFKAERISIKRTTNTLWALAVCLLLKNTAEKMASSGNKESMPLLRLDGQSTSIGCADFFFRNARTNSNNQFVSVGPLPTAATPTRILEQASCFPFLKHIGTNRCALAASNVASTTNAVPLSTTRTCSGAKYVFRKTGNPSCDP